MYLLSAALSYPSDRFRVPFCGATVHPVRSQACSMKRTYRLPQLRSKDDPHALLGAFASTCGWSATCRFVVLLVAHALTKLPALVLTVSAVDYVTTVL